MKQVPSLIMHLIPLVFIIIVSCSSADIVIKKGSPHVKLTQGVYVGKVGKSRGGQDFYEFWGLKYANAKRFQPPELYTGDDDIDANEPQEVHHAYTPGPRCPQQFGVNVTGSEDCLFLNVFVPKRTPPNGGFPILVWIHGGAFSFGSGDKYEAKFFMDEDIILVTINYRLGAFGFISTGNDGVIRGNMGLRDQQTALKWVQQNAEFFEGDKKRVTIAGNSAGSSSVQYLLLSPMTKGLFHSCIMQSGSVHNLWAFTPNPEPVAKELGKLLECDIETSNLLLECLESKTVREIISAQARMKRWYIDPIAVFSPTVELNAEDAFLPDYPDKIIERREFKRVPLLIGMVQDEGLTMNSVGVINSAKLTSQIDSDFETIAPITFNFRNWFPSSSLKEISVKLRKFYFGDKAINRESMQNLTNLYSDANFVYGIWKAVAAHATETPVYPYLMTFQGEHSSSTTELFTLSDEKYGGASHGDELQYLFRCDLFPKEIPKGSEEEKFSIRLVKLWASFITHRKPTETWGSVKNWPSISKAQLQGDQPFKWYRLDKDTSIVENPCLERKQFWDKIFKKYSQSNVKDEL